LGHNNGGVSISDYRSRRQTLVRPGGDRFFGAGKRDLRDRREPSVDKQPYEPPVVEIITAEELLESIGIIDCAGSGGGGGGNT
jgi:hypothetical protein